MIKIKKRFIKKIKIKQRKLVDEAGKVLWKEEYCFYLFIYVTHVNSHFLCTYTLKIIHINLHTTKKNFIIPMISGIHFFESGTNFLITLWGLFMNCVKPFNFCNVCFGLFYLKPQCFMIVIKIRLKFFNDWCQDLIEKLCFKFEYFWN